MISKELLSEVIGVKVTQVDHIEDDEKELPYWYDSEVSDYFEHINIYELAHKCKEWLKNKNIFVMSGFNYYYDSYIAVINQRHDDWNLFDHIVKANTEPESIFKACQWVLDNKAKQCS